MDISETRKKPAIAAIMGHIPEDPHEISETY